MKFFRGDSKPVVICSICGQPLYQTWEKTLDAFWADLYSEDATFVETHLSRHGNSDKKATDLIAFANSSVESIQK